MFPTPLINRLEKHFVLTSSVLEDWQSEVLAELEEWVKMFSHVSNADSRLGDVSRALISNEKNNFFSIDSRKRMLLWAINLILLRLWYSRLQTSCTNSKHGEMVVSCGGQHGRVDCRETVHWQTLTRKKAQSSGNKQ